MLVLIIIMAGLNGLKMSASFSDCRARRGHFPKVSLCSCGVESLESSQTQLDKCLEMGSWLLVLVCVAAAAVRRKDRFTGALFSEATGPDTTINISSLEDDQVSLSVCLRLVCDQLVFYSFDINVLRKEEKRKAMVVRHIMQKF